MADRLARFHAPIVQANTGAGFGGECHLDANMVRSGLAELPLHATDVLVLENVGLSHTRRIQGRGGRPGDGVRDHGG